MILNGIIYVHRMIPHFKPNTWLSYNNTSLSMVVISCGVAGFRSASLNVFYVPSPFIALQNVLSFVGVNLFFFLLYQLHATLWNIWNLTLLGCPLFFLICCHPLISHVNVRCAPVMFPRNVSCFFLISGVISFQITLNLLHCSYFQSMAFSLSVCRTAYFFLRVSSSSVRKYNNS